MRKFIIFKKRLKSYIGKRYFKGELYFKNDFQTPGYYFTVVAYIEPKKFLIRKSNIIPPKTVLLKASKKFRLKEFLEIQKEMYSKNKETLDKLVNNIIKENNLTLSNEFLDCIGDKLQEQKALR